MNYKFANLLGAPYRGGNILFHGNELLSPVGNRVCQVRDVRLPLTCHASNLSVKSTCKLHRTSQARLHV
jgi:hypothetical protein